MFKLKMALHNLKRTKLLSILTILELTAAVVICMIMVSAICIRYRYYQPFSDMLDGNGLYCYFAEAARTGYTENDKVLVNDDVFTMLNGAEDIAACNQTYVFMKPSADLTLMNSYSYNDTLIERYQPTLKDGRWLNTSDEADTLEVVVSKNNFGWKVGDKIDLYFNYDDPVSKQAEVVGVLSDSPKIFGGNSRFGENNDYNVFYTEYSLEIEEMPLLIFSSEYLENNIPDAEQGLNTSVLISFSDNLSDEMKAENKTAMQKIGSVVTMDFQTVKTNSIKYLAQQLYILLPVIIVIMILTLVSSVSCCALITRDRLRDYAVFNLCGMVWRKSTTFNLISTLIMCGTSAVLTAVAIAVIRFTPLEESVTLMINPFTILSAIAIMAIFTAFSMIMPIAIIGSSTTKEILTDKR